jgi:hypothetical protein
VFDEPSVSRTHAVFSLTKGGIYVLEDNSSTNGTFVDGVKIKRAQISESDHVMLGEYETQGKYLMKELKKRKKKRISHLLGLIFQDSFTRTAAAIIAAIMIIMALVTFSLIKFSSRRIIPPPDLKPISRFSDSRSIGNYKPFELNKPGSGLEFSPRETSGASGDKGAPYPDRTRYFARSLWSGIHKAKSLGGERRF